MKNWIKISEIKEILKTYSIEKEEFEKLNNLEYCYLNKKLGYMITITPEEEHWYDGNERKTGRILVTHTRGNGKKTYLDVWERDSQGKLQFIVRNLDNQPLSDAEVIRGLEKQNEELRRAGSKLQEELRQSRQLQNQKNNNEEYQILITENQKLKIQLQSALQENKKIKEQYTIHNARGAGRKKADEKWMARYSDFISLYESQKSIKEIRKIMNISKPTYYRYLKYYRSEKDS